MIDRYIDSTGTTPATFLLLGGGRIELTPQTRTVFSAANQHGDLMAAGTDESGPWTAFAARQAGAQPDCYRASGAVWNDSDAVVFSGFRFMKAAGFATEFLSTQRGQRYPVGDPCFDGRFEVLGVGYP